MNPPVSRQPNLVNLVYGACQWKTMTGLFFLRLKSFIPINIYIYIFLALLNLVYPNHTWSDVINSVNQWLRDGKVRKKVPMTEPNSV
jgi:hypothetical protein